MPCFLLEFAWLWTLVISFCYAYLFQIKKDFYTGCEATQALLLSQTPYPLPVTLNRLNSTSLPLKHFFLSLNHSCTSFPCTLNSTALSKCHGISNEMPIIFCSPLAPPPLHSKVKSLLCSWQSTPVKLLLSEMCLIASARQKKGIWQDSWNARYYWHRKVALLSSLCHTPAWPSRSYKFSPPDEKKCIRNWDSWQLFDCQTWQDLKSGISGKASLLCNLQGNIFLFLIDYNRKYFIMNIPAWKLHCYNLVCNSH